MSVPGTDWQDKWELIAKERQRRREQRMIDALKDFERQPQHWTELSRPHYWTELWEPNTSETNLARLIIDERERESTS